MRLEKSGVDSIYLLDIFIWMGLGESRVLLMDGFGNFVRVGLGEIRVELMNGKKLCT